MQQFHENSPYFVGVVFCSETDGTVRSFSKTDCIKKQ